MLVYPDGKGGLVSDLRYLPDTTRLRVIKPYAYLASNEITFTFQERDADAGDLRRRDGRGRRRGRRPQEGGGRRRRDAKHRRGRTHITGSVPPPVPLRVVHDPDGEWRLVGARDGEEEGYGLNPAGTARMDVKVTQSQPPKPEPPAKPKTGG